MNALSYRARPHPIDAPLFLRKLARPLIMGVSAIITICTYGIIAYVLFCFAKWTWYTFDIGSIITNITTPDNIKLLTVFLVICAGGMLCKMNTSNKNG